MDKPRILLVDDEPMVLNGLMLNLRPHFDVTTAVGGTAGIVVLKSKGPFAAVVSDMRMPVMDGATFLMRARHEAPETVRLVLTGQTELGSAIMAVNKGQVFRFLTKPCPAEDLIEALQAAAEQFRLITAEKVLLQQTLHGSIKLLTDLLAISNPAAYGRASRVKARISALGESLQVPDLYMAEMAAMLSQLGAVLMSTQISEKVYLGQPLTPGEQAIVERLPIITHQLLANIPRLEKVQEILKYQGKHFDGSGTPVDGVNGLDLPWGARAIKLIHDFDVMEAKGMTIPAALEVMRNREGSYDPQLMQAFSNVLKNIGQGEVVRELLLQDLREGMVFAEDIKAKNGSLLIARGYVVTASVLERLRNFSSDLGVVGPLPMILRPL